MRRTYSLAVGDIDHDGVADIAVAGNEFIFYEHNLSEELVPETRTELNLIYGGAASGFAASAIQTCGW